MSAMPFGKHRGEDVEDVPTDYLVWFVSNVKDPKPGTPFHGDHVALVKEIEEELACRKKYGHRP